MKNPELSIIITNWNGRIHLSECFESLRKQTFRDYEILMVDNNSQDDSIEYTKDNFPEVKIIQSEMNRGYCGGNNLGCESSKGKFILFLNNDTVLHEDCLDELVKTLKSADGEIIGVFPKVKYYKNPQMINAIGVVWHKRIHWRDHRVGTFDFGQHKNTEVVFGSIFPALLIKKKEFIAIGMFDESFFAQCEDFDLCYRANILGYRFLIQPKAEILHKYRATSKELFRPHWHHYFFVRNYMLVFLKNYEMRNLLKHLPYAFYRYVIKGLMQSVKRFDYKFLFIYLRIIIYLILKSPHWMKRRKQIQSKRVIDDVKLWKDTQVEEFNPFNYKGRFVYSLLNLRASLNESLQYEVDGKLYTIK